jgi:hypothetical protein
MRRRRSIGACGKLDHRRSSNPRAYGLRHCRKCEKRDYRIWDRDVSVARGIFNSDDERPGAVRTKSDIVESQSISCRDVRKLIPALRLYDILARKSDFLVRFDKDGAYVLFTFYTVNASSSSSYCSKEISNPKPSNILFNDSCWQVPLAPLEASESE